MTWLLPFLLRALRCSFFVLILTIPSVAWSATRWVSKSGANSNSCAAIASDTQPGNLATGSRLTIISGISCLQPGDTLIIKAGTYEEGIVNAPTGGTTTNRITIKAASGETVIVKNVGTTAIGTLLTFKQANQSYVTVEGMIFDGENEVGYIVWLEDVTQVELKNVEVRNGRAQGILAGTNANSTYLRFINVNAHHNGLNCDTVGLCHGLYLSNIGHIIEGGQYHNNESHGLHLYSAPKATTVRGVKAYDNGFTGIGVYNQSNNNLYNNLSYNNGADGIRFGSASSTIANNTTYGNGQCGIRVVGSNNVARNNIAFNNTTTSQICNSGTNTTLSHNLTTNPNFVNAAAGDFSLLSTSAAIDFGTVLSSGCAQNNCAGTFAGSAPDAGAHETIPAPLSASIESAAPNIVRINWPLNTAVFAPLASCTAANFDIRINGVAQTESACTVVGSNRTDVTIGNSVTSGQSVTGLYTAGTLRNSAGIGKTSDDRSTGSNQKVFTTPTFAVQNNVDPGSCVATPTISSIIVQDATPTVATFCIATSNPPMTPASPTECAGFSITNKTESAGATSCIRNATDNKCFDFTVTSAFTVGEVQTAAYDPPTGNVHSSGTCTPELSAFTLRAIQNNVQGSVPTGLIGHWTLDHASGTTATDSSGNSHTGTLTGFDASPTWTAGLVGTGALIFNGSDEYVTVADHANLDFSSTYTLAAWVKIDSFPTGNPEYVLAKRDTSEGYNISLNSSGNFGMVDGAAVNKSTGWTVPVGEWHHLAIVVDTAGTNMVGYLDGVAGSPVAITAIAANAHPLILGGRTSGAGASNFFDGTQDDVRIYNTALTEPQIQEIIAPGPVATSAVVDTATPGIVKFCASTSNPPLLPASNCALAGFTMVGHTITDCDRAGASAPDDSCMNLAVTPDFSSGEPARFLSYDPSLGDVRDSGSGNPELALFTGLDITNNVNPGAVINRDQELCQIECWGGDEDSPDCVFSLNAQQNTYAGGCFRVRCSVDNEGSNDVGSRGYTYYTSKNGGAYEAVTDTVSTDGIWFATPPELTPTSTTERLTVPDGNFIPGATMLAAAQVPLVPATGDSAWAGGKRTEFMGAFCLGSNVTAGADCTAADDWQFEIREGDGTQMETYTVRPQVCVASGLGLSVGGGVGGGLRQ